MSRRKISIRLVLRNVNANTTIPKILRYLTGAIAYKEAGDRDEYSDRLETAKRFYDAVIENQTYATGGIGDMEHFFADGLLDASRTQCNAESCCCYNMMKLSGLLFMMTGETKYIEYTEKTLWNARLGSIGPEGGYTYFNPMGTGYYRLYSPAKPEDNPFWCCVGTGMEDFASFADKICYVEDRTLIITQWISSDMTLGDERYELRADHKKGKLSLSGTGGNVKLRIPAWIKNRDRILPEKSDYLDISFEKDRTFELDFDMEISLLSLPDEPAAKGFSYGPFVLCVPLGKDKWGITENAGIEVSAPAWKVVFGESYKGSITYGKTTRKVLDSEYLTLPKGETIESFSKGFRKYIIVKDDSLYLSGLSDCNGNELELPLIPYYLTGNMRYGIYWYFSSPNPGAKASVSPVTLNKKDT
ncbi:MAG: glycoside hydrolase family 127 protein [Lachnospiraceae bacterium]|nr:glycoside hydrolase family 127 protein [Lachnospiraceae bacterium]